MQPCRRRRLFHSKVAYLDHSQAQDGRLLNKLANAPPQLVCSDLDAAFQRSAAAAGCQPSGGSGGRAPLSRAPPCAS